MIISGREKQAERGGSLGGEDMGSGVSLSSKHFRLRELIVKRQSSKHKCYTYSKKVKPNFIVL
jgi:hypothetical protein